MNLGDFNEGALLHSIRYRHAEQKIFTAIGSPILISVNPYQKLDIFNTKVARRYREYSLKVRESSNQDALAHNKPAPHLFGVAEDSY